MQISSQGVFAQVDFIVVAVNNYCEEPLIYSCFERSEMALRGFTANVNINETVLYPDSNSDIIMFPKIESTNHYTKIMNGKEPISHGVCISKAINEKYLITNQGNKKRDLYNYMMNKFSLPLLEEWIPYILEEGKQQILEVQAEIYGRVPVEFDNIVIYQTSLTEVALKEIVINGLKNKKIWIVEEEQLPLQFKDMDDYFMRYGSTLIENLEKKLEPLVPLKDKVDEIAFLKRKFYPQQAAIVNGLIAAMDYGNYAFINEDMGCGKTLQGMGVIEGYFNKKASEKSGKTMKEIYMDKEAVKYRNIIMCPSHLVKKWAESIKEDIPYAKVTIVHGLKELIKLWIKGKKRRAKEFYIFSKDNGKLSYSYMPLPTQIKNSVVAGMVCKECGLLRSMNSFEVCSCGCKEWVLQKYEYRDTGLICPECSQLLYPADRNIFEPNPEEQPLQTEDFATKSKANYICRHCGASLWQPACEPLQPSFFFQRHKQRTPKWKKLTHFSNLAKKNKRTVWVYEKNEENYKTKNELIEEEISYPNIYGPRRFAPTRFVKKYLQDFFDFAIFDEAHEYKGGGSAQGFSMHDIIAATKWHIAMTGTISGGYASHFFYLLYRLDPARMKSMGYEYSSAGERKFVENYGTISTEYEVPDSAEQYNSMSRGRMIGTPKCIPGISLRIFTDFLLDKAVFLNLSDMSSYLPTLKEIVEYVPLENDIYSAYQDVRERITKAMKLPKVGKSLLGTYLQFSLSYTDKPYGRSPVLFPTDGSVAAHIPDLSHLIEDEKLLNKEKRLIELIQNELSEDRNMFVYCEYTGTGEGNISYRLKEIIEKNCKLESHEVTILESSYPSAEEREEWMHEKAAEGAKVFITNPRCVKTGLDFLFYYNEIMYNYPTLIFYQYSYDLITMWQASRRGYRLNQIEECRIFYLLSDNTIQIDALEMVASKQVATSAIQGQFSSEGLCAMAQSVDPKIKLAQAAAEKDPEQKRGLKGMFDVLNQWHKGEGKKQEPNLMLTFNELTGLEIPNEEDEFRRAIMEAASSNNLFSILAGPMVPQKSDDKKSVIDEDEQLKQKTVKIKEPAVSNSANEVFSPPPKEDTSMDLFKAFFITPTPEDKPKKVKKQSNNTLFDKFFNL